MTGKHGTVEERLWDKVVVDPYGGCWEWVGAKCRGGYGHMGGANGEHLRAPLRSVLTVTL